MTYRGHIQNGMVVFDPPAELPEGADVEVSVIVRRPPITSIEELQSKLPDADKDFGPEFEEALRGWRAARVPANFWHNKSADELACEQDVKPLQSIEELRGDWPDEDSIDEFLAFIREGRR